MNAKKTICILLALALPLAAAPLQALAESRDIYIGDAIALQIESQKFSAEEIRAELEGKNFEIIEIKERSGGYLVSVRTFEIGEHKIFFGSREIVINVRSSLEDMSIEGIHEGEGRMAEAGFWVPWRELFCVFAGIFAVSGGFALKKKLAPKRSAKSPLESFMDSCLSLSGEAESYLVDLTHNFKKYLEALCKFKTIGKTSAEIAGELKKIDALGGILPDIEKWLLECDQMKFAGINANNGEKEGHYVKLLHLVKEIDMQKEGMA